MTAITWHPERILICDEIHWPDDGVPTRKDLAPGTARWDLEIGARRLEYVCPCGCGHVRSLPVAREKIDRMWLWDGNEINPSIMPSIQIIGTCGWHGYLTMGIWQSC